MIFSNKNTAKYFKTDRSFVESGRGIVADQNQGQPLEKYFAQENLFGVDSDSLEILTFQHDNVRCQKE